MSVLRGFQQEIKDSANAAWDNGAEDVMFQSATGSGKTVVMGSIAKDHIVRPRKPHLAGGCSMAHRSELVGQMSIQLAREDIPHDIIAPQKTIRGIVDAHMDELGRTFYNARSPWRVASVDTIVRRHDVLSDWLAKVGMVHIDEAHHVLRDNKWGRARAMFPNAIGLLPTATPIRADGKSLGREGDGIADVLVEGPPMRWLIDNAYLTDYKVYAIPPKDLHLEGVKIAADGDYNMSQLRDAVHASNSIVGDVVQTYIKYAMGRLGVTFAVDIAHATEITAAFNLAGVPAALVTSDTEDSDRRAIIKRFRNRELLQLVNVDLFGEGFDLPAIECVSFARPTASFSLYSQQWGRALRLMISKLLAGAWDTYTVEQRKYFIENSGKPFAYIFDHAGNFYRHEGPPDKPRVWKLATRQSRGKSDGIPMRVCLNVKCAKPYERFFTECPYCGTAPPLPSDRSGANTVDGDITLIDPLLLAKYRGEIARIDAEPVVPYGVPRLPFIANHRNRQRAQYHLRDAMAWWAGSYPDAGNQVNYKRFYLTFGIDVLAAKTLNESDGTALREKIIADLNARGIITTINNEMEVSYD